MSNLQPITKVDDASDLAAAVLQDWGDIDGFPSRSSVEFIVSELYRLSLTADEGRYPRLLFAFPGIKTRDETFVPLGCSQLYLADIVSLAPAIAPPPYALVLSGAPERCEGVVCVAKDADLNPGVYFGIRGPGEIEVSVYEQGAMKSWLLSRGVCRQVQSLKENVALKALCEQAIGETSHRPEVAMNLLQHLLYSISERGHGGSLLFLDGEAANVSNPRIDFLTKPFPLLAQSHEEEEEEEEGQGEKRHKRLVSRATAVSCLSQIDGAMLLDFKMRVRAAGLFVNLHPTSVWPTCGPHAGEETEMGLLGLGTRHRSAASFCEDNPGAVACVVSQDRAIRIFSLVKSQLVLDGPYADLMILS